jgi:carbonic anhydrase
MDAVDRIVAGAMERRPRRVGEDARPRMGLAVLTCMDARLDPARLLDLGLGDAHVLRNGGGVVTTDVLESLAMSQERFGTRKVVVIHHTQCAALATRLPKQSAEASVRAAVRLLRASPGLPHRDAVRGFVLDIERGTLTEVPAERAHPATAPARAPAAAASPRGPPLSRCLWCKRAFDPRTSSWRRGRRLYCGDLCRLAARAGGPAPS